MKSSSSSCTRGGDESFLSVYKYRLHGGEYDARADNEESRTVGLFLRVHDCWGLIKR